MGRLPLVKDLALSWTSRTIRGRYQQSMLGWLWAILQPAGTVAIFTVIFTKVIPVDTGETPYAIFSYVAMVPWTFLTTSLTDMSDSLVVNMSLVTKIYFPREAIPLAVMLARLIDFGIAALLIVVLMIYYHMQPFPILWLFLPLILGIQIALILGLGMACAATNVFFRDVSSLMKLGIQIWFYACPVIYPVSMVPEYLLNFYFLNPMVGILQSYRDVLLDGRVPGSYLWLSAVISLFILAAGYFIFKRLEPKFADII